MEARLVGLFNKLFSFDKDEQDQNLKDLIVNLVCVFGLLIHLLLIPAFSYVGADGMARFNVISVLIWAAALYASRHGFRSTAVFVACLEVLLHSIVAVINLGLAPGFQHYLWAISVLALLNTSMRLSLALAFGFTFVLTFALLDLLFADVVYRYAHPELMPYVHTANILIAGIPLMITGMIFRGMYENHVDHLSRLASLDGMTGLFNRRFTTDMASKLKQWADREGKDISLILIDIDHFKHINDRFGHHEGDAVIKHIARLMHSMLRKSDVVSRWGGEEFLVILPGTAGDAAHAVAESLRKAVADQVALPDTTRSRVTISLGIKQWLLHESFEQAVQLADEALYHSKTKGRNRVTHHTGDVCQACP